MSGDAHRNGDGQAEAGNGPETLAPAAGEESWNRPRRTTPGPTPE